VKHKYHIIYKTTCTVTDRYYVGMHSTNDLNDRYLGSGKVLFHSIRKHGRHNHRYEILEHASTREELTQREKEIVNADLVADPNCLNLVQGGNTAPYEYDRNPKSSQLQAQSLRQHFANHENRERQRRINSGACQRLDVIKNIAKKLTVEDVREIRRLYEAGEHDYAALGRQFNVSGNTIWMIVTRRTWKHV